MRRDRDERIRAADFGIGSKSVDHLLRPVGPERDWLKCGNIGASQRERTPQERRETFGTRELSERDAELFPDLHGNVGMRPVRRRAFNREQSCC